MNVDPQQESVLQRVMKRHPGLQTAGVYPMLRGRLGRIEQHLVSPDDYASPRARRLAAREFNLSWSAERPPHNRLVEGDWWTPAEAERPLILRFDPTLDPVLELSLSGEGVQFEGEEGLRRLRRLAELQVKRALEPVKGVAAVDPPQTTLPSAWKRLPAYPMNVGDTMRLVQKRRGDASPPPDRPRTETDAGRTSSAGTAP